MKQVTKKEYKGKRLPHTRRNYANKVIASHAKQMRKFIHEK